MSDEDYGDDEVETAIVYGTPLDPLDEESVAKKKKPIAIEDQIVTDENGRRRFHGAFTGGFSAGYFNTVGTRDGWSPAHFKSSRGSKGQPSKEMQKPEDFMDAEDLGEFGIAPQGLKTSAQFKRPEDATKKRKREAAAAGADGDGDGSVIPGRPVQLDELFRPVTDTVGVSLLRAMGWRPGQGIGPRLSRKQKAKQAEANQRMFGCPLPPSQGDKRSASSDDDDDDDSLDPKYRAFLFAPDDVPEFLAKPKDNLFGIGYSGLDRSTLSGHISLFDEPQQQKGLTMTGAKSNRKIKFSGQAFGVGAYEDEDDDVYSRDHMEQYDFELAPEGEKGGAKRKGERKRSRWSQEVTEHVAKIIEGFQLSKSTSTIRKKLFPPPELPKGFVPRVGVKKSRFEPDPKLDERLKTTNPTPSQRQQAISLPKDRSEEAPRKPTQSDDQIMKLLAAAANTPVTDMESFKPFARDAEKQKRYEKYLVCVKNNRGDALDLLQPKTMTDWEKERERVEFERAVVMFRPMTGTMNSKFVSAGSSQDAAEAKGGLEEDDEEIKDAKKAAKMKMFGKLTREKFDWHPAKMLCIRFNVKHPYGDYSVVGVAPSGPKAKAIAAPETGKDRSNFNLFDSVATGLASVTPEAIERDGGREDPTPGPSRMDTDNLEPSAAEEKDEEVEEVKKPPIDLFKSIFLDSDSDDESDAPKKTEEKSPKKRSEKEETFGSELEATTASDKKPWEEKRENVLRNPAPARGIFANVDFDLLNRKKAPSDSKSETREEKTSASELKSAGRKKAADFFDAGSDDEEASTSSAVGANGKRETFPQMEVADDKAAFGPARPPLFAPPKFRKPRRQSTDSEDSEEWVEAGKGDRAASADKRDQKKVKKAKKAKKVKKAKKSSHKKRKKRKKGKKKKKHRRDSSSSSTSDEASSSTDSD